MRTYCRICEAACGLIAEHDEHGQLVRLRPDREHPGSRGHVCAKGTRFLEVARHSERLLHPRLDGRPVSWSEAIDGVAQRLRAVIDAHGPHAVGVYFGNPMAFNAMGAVSTLAFGKALGTRNVFYAGSQDCNNKFAGADIVHGTPVVQAVPDLGHTDLALVFGSNPYVSQSSFVHMEGGSAATFRGILDRGGSIVWVDPRRTESAQRWGEHLAIRPGTDAWLLVGLLALCADGAPSAERVDGWNELRAAVERVSLAEVAARTGIARPEIERLAARLRSAPAAALHMSVGVNMGGFGTLAYVLLQALAWVTGNYDRRGGLLVSPMARTVDRVFRWSGVHNEHRSRVGGFRSLLGTLPGGVLADEILEPGPERIRALVVLAGDPLRSIPGAARTEQALRSLDVLACVDMFESATGRHAHALLPATSWLERWDLAVASMPFLQGPLLPVSGPVMPPQGEARSDTRILAELAVALGLPGPHWRLARLPLDRWLPRPRFGLPVPRVRPGRWLRRNRLRLWDERVADELRRLRAEPSAALDVPWPEADPHAFTLIGRRRRLGHNSWLHGGQRTGPDEAVAWLSPSDLAALGVDDGQLVEIQGSGGSSLRIPVRAAEGMAPRTVVVPHGLPGLNINALIPAGVDRIERVSGQLVMTGISARVIPIQGGAGG
ncbi:molybdopterin-containing oxidoreductase family protein [Paraliomyxa miuraensis]|uniref:molybdopterin-containing oxidoreductase family protein n=1 Tax=Paraliomyxa miuraensis TaxID=376150 RepID=UPI00225A3AE2|nr:molybdopterin-dependent oxidoreductase [Paraliomyxa miuraensis]MCX4243930.1 molybdopterin-dependent oxidoreductase [Paraliomyxa miuraensis]